MVSFAARDARPRPEERVCRKSSADSNARARVSKDEDERLGFALMLRDASQRALAVDAPPLASRCDAPQHEGEGKHQPAAVRNDGRRRFPVSGLLFTGSGATATCRAGKGPMWHHQSSPSVVIPICQHPSS